MKKEWKPREAYPQSLDEEFSDFDPLARQLLYSRGIVTVPDAKKFLNPDYVSGLRDPFLIKNMKPAAERVIKGIERKEKIVICGDYDADGICASAIFADFFRTIGFSNYEIYIPDRYKEGHGFSRKSVDYVLSRKAGLVITVDNGITNFDEIKSAEEKGVNVIVLDHHIVPEKIPPAFAVIDLFQKGEEFPFLDFCGAGLAFKFVSAVLAENSFGLVKGWEKWLLDFAAIGTVADMVSLRDENRVLVHWGLKVLAKNRRSGIKAIAAKSGVNLSKITSEDIAFYFGPRVNVAGRLDHATLAGELLLTDSADEAEWLAGRLEEKNNERKGAVERIVKFVRDDVARGDLPDVIVYGNFDWHPGVLGAACGRLTEMLSRSVILWGKGESDAIKGSVRGDGQVNILELVKKAGTEMYIDVGGHPMACGFTLKEEFASRFKERILEAFNKMPKVKNIYNELVLEKELVLDDVTKSSLDTIARFEPFGQANPKPVFLFRNLFVEGARSFGNDGAHLELIFKNSSGAKIPAVGFWASNGMPPINKGERIDLAASMEMSNFKGYDELRLRIADYKKI